MLSFYLLTIVGLYMFGMTIILTILTLVYPCYKSILAIESNDENDQKQWLSFWCCYSFSFVWQITLGPVFAMIMPYYWLFRILYFVWLMAPVTKGALVMYHAVISPNMKRNKHKIVEL